MNSPYDILIIFGAIYLLFLTVLFAIIWFFRQPEKSRQEILALTLVALPVTYVVAKLVSLLYFDPRPFAAGNFTPLIFHIPDNGFPSDHTLLAGALSAIIFFYDKKVGVVFFALSFLIGISRVLAGVHHLSDILGSLAIALAVTYLIRQFVMPYLSKTETYKKYFT